MNSLLTFLQSLDRNALVPMFDQDSTAVDVVSFEIHIKTDGLSALEKLSVETQNNLVSAYYGKLHGLFEGPDIDEEGEGEGLREKASALVEKQAPKMEMLALELLSGNYPFRASVVEQAVDHVKYMVYPDHELKALGQAMAKVFGKEGVPNDR